MRSETPHYTGDEPHANAITNCRNCRAAMPREMRFCRACGQRLGEGLAEYVETVRLDRSSPAAGRAGQVAASVLSPETMSSRRAKNFGARIADDVTHGALKGVEELFRNLENAFKQNQVKLSVQTSRLSSFGCGAKAFRFNGQNEDANKRNGRNAKPMTWVGLCIVMVLFFSLVGSLVSSNSHRRNRDGRATAVEAREKASTALRRQAAALRETALKVRNDIIAGTNGARFNIGVSEFKSAGGGAFIEAIAVPGSPADKAGLVGGDVITSLDNQPVKSATDLRKLLAAMPVGKSVDAVFLRDGETKRTTIVPVSTDELESIADSWDESSDKHATLGLDDSDFRRVAVPGTNLYGVRVGEIVQGSPADLAGLHENDLVIEFGGVPIRTSEELAARIERATPGSVIKTIVMRSAERLELPVRVNEED